MFTPEIGPKSLLTIQASKIGYVDDEVIAKFSVAGEVTTQSDSAIFAIVIIVIVVGAISVFFIIKKTKGSEEEEEYEEYEEEI